MRPEVRDQGSEVSQARSAGVRTEEEVCRLAAWLPASPARLEAFLAAAREARARVVDPARAFVSRNQTKKTTP